MVDGGALHHGPSICRYHATMHRKTSPATPAATYPASARVNNIGVGVGWGVGFGVGAGVATTSTTMED